MKKFGLIPEAKHQQMMTIEKRDVLQSIKKPEQRKMLNRYQLAQNILNDPEHSHDDVKMDKYNEIMLDFSMLRDLNSTVRPLETQQQQPAVEEQEDEKNDLSNDDVDANLVDVLSNNQQINAKKLLRLLRSQGSDVITGDVSIHVQILPGTNIADLVSDIVCSTPSKISSPQRAHFVNTLAEASIPKTLVKNKAALEQYRMLKKSKGDFTERVIANGESRTFLPTARKRKNSKQLMKTPLTVSFDVIHNFQILL